MALDIRSPDSNDRQICTILEQLHKLLKDNTFFGGDFPCELDAHAFGALVKISTLYCIASYDVTG